MASIHALVLDDNPNNLGILAELLTLEGASVTTVQNPLKLGPALDSLEQLDVIFLDLEMPGMDGYEVLEQLKANPQWEGVPVVAYTVHISEINVARRLGFHSFLGKPLDADLFPEQLARILQGERVWEIP